MPLVWTKCTTWNWPHHAKQGWQPAPHYKPPHPSSRCPMLSANGQPSWGDSWWLRKRQGCKVHTGSISSNSMDSYFQQISLSYSCCNWRTVVPANHEKLQPNSGVPFYQHKRPTVERLVFSQQCCCLLDGPNLGWSQLRFASAAMALRYATLLGRTCESMGHHWLQSWFAWNHLITSGLLLHSSLHSAHEVQHMGCLCRFKSRHWIIPKRHRNDMLLVAILKTCIENTPVLASHLSPLLRSAHGCHGRTETHHICSQGLLESSFGKQLCWMVLICSSYLFPWQWYSVTPTTKRQSWSAWRISTAACQTSPGDWMSFSRPQTTWTKQPLAHAWMAAL